MGAKRPRRNLEQAEQVALFQWAALAIYRYPELEWLYAVPNFARAGKRGDRQAAAEVARRLKEGMKPGVLDIHLPVARGGFHGLWIEMKSPDGTPSPHQRRWMKALTEQGHSVHICRSFEAARAVIERYLDS